VCFSFLSALEGKTEVYCVHPKSVQRYFVSHRACFPTNRAQLPVVEGSEISESASVSLGSWSPETNSGAPKRLRAHNDLFEEVQEESAVTAASISKDADHGFELVDFSEGARSADKSPVRLSNDEKGYESDSEASTDNKIVLPPGAHKVEDPGELPSSLRPLFSVSNNTTFSVVSPSRGGSHLF